jgi:hypothetical protein
VGKGLLVFVFVFVFCFLFFLFVSKTYNEIINLGLTKLRPKILIIFFGPFFFFFFEPYYIGALGKGLTRLGLEPSLSILTDISI